MGITTKFSTLRFLVCFFLAIHNKCSLARITQKNYLNDSKHVQENDDEKRKSWFSFICKFFELEPQEKTWKCSGIIVKCAENS